MEASVNDVLTRHTRIQRGDSLWLSMDSSAHCGGLLHDLAVYIGKNPILGTVGIDFCCLISRTSDYHKIKSECDPIGAVLLPSFRSLAN